MDFVNVAVRIRPNFDQDARCLDVVKGNVSIIYIPDRAQAYGFDSVFDENADQETVYQTMVKPLVDKVKEGYSCTVFAYGQTGTGKTYTMGSNSSCHVEDAGFISRALDEFFYEKHSNVYTETQIFVSFYEIYNEKVFDLLCNGKTPLLVKEFRVQGLSKNCVKTPYEATRLLEIGSKKRHVGGTNQNSNSSRSHAIFTIQCNIKDEHHETIAKLNLVDLAGSESVKKTGNRGSQLYEGININKGLLCIGQVMNALSRNDDFVPYRQSMITTILQDSLNKTNYVTLVACISPNVEDVHETVHTLDFASRAKKLKNRPELNKFKKENPQLFCKSVTKFTTPMKGVNLSYPTSSAKKRKLTDIEVNSLPVPGLDSCKNSFLKDLSDISTSTAIGTKISPICSSTPWTGNKENIFPWDQLEATISSIVRKEIQQFQVSQSAAINNIEKIVQQKFKESFPVRKALDFATPPHDDNKEQNDTFKLPSIPKRFAATSSPNEAPPTLRRSARLSLKKTDVSLNTSNSFFENTQSNRRKSARLLQKTDIPKPLPRTMIAPTPAPRRTKTKVSPKTAHSNRVFEILNSGSEKQLQTLATIGPKSASLIRTYRAINGNFAKLTDLKNLPFWGERAYARFCNANFLFSKE